MAGTAVHFGGGALGRGLVVPLLVESGYDVVLADVDSALLDELNGAHGYHIDVTDAKDGENCRWIPVASALNSASPSEELRRSLSEARVITTAVRRENLRYVVDALLAMLDGTEQKLLICAENIEHVGAFVRQLLSERAVTDEQRRRASQLIVPDTVVDRICSSPWPETSVVVTEQFHELAVDARVVADTGIELIPAVDDLERAFVRKRLLVNTFADASAFMALPCGLRYLHEAVTDEDVQRRLAPYFEGFATLLTSRYGYTRDEVDAWCRLYRKRLANPLIRRELPSVARNLWAKLTLDERFVWPLAQLLELGVDVEPSVRVLTEMVSSNCEEGPSDIARKLTDIWGEEKGGQDLLDMAKRFL